MNAKRALITGIGGQDGALLARHLLGLGYEVAGLVRPSSSDGALWRLRKLGLMGKIALQPGDVLERASLDCAISEFYPDEVYNLAALSSPRACREVPALAIRTASEGLLNVLESAGRARRVFQAGSLADYPTANGPYAIGKAAASALVRYYREQGWWVCEARMGNHESPLRSSEFICQQIARAAARGERMTLRDPSAEKDIGWAEDYIREMHTMLQRAEPSDMVLCTGWPCALGEFQEAAMHECYEPVESGKYTLWPQVAKRMVQAIREEQRA